MYNGLIAAVAIVTMYLVAMTVLGHFRPGMRVFKPKAVLCLILGCLLAIPVGGVLFERGGKTAGYVGVGVSIALMYALFYSGIINRLIKRLPAAVRKGFTVAWCVFRMLLIAAAIVFAVIWVLKFVGI